MQWQSKKGEGLSVWIALTYTMKIYDNDIIYGVMAVNLLTNKSTDPSDICIAWSTSPKVACSFTIYADIEFPENDHMVKPILFKSLKTSKSNEKIQNMKLVDNNGRPCRKEELQKSKKEKINENQKM